MNTAMVAIPQSDEELAALAGAEGPESRQALGELLGRHGRRLHRFFTMQFRDEELTKDLVQEVFERVIRARGRLPRDQGFRPWLWTIAINLAHSVRRKRRTTAGSVSLDDPPAPGAIPLGERLADETPTPRGRAAESERTAHLLGAVERLEEAQREVILLKYFQGLPCREVAEILGVSEGTVWSRTHRALRRLREILEPELNPREGGASPC
jgi:RNA polymerase sigma-70 factor (ECF subfamily)